MKTLSKVVAGLSLVALGMASMPSRAEAQYPKRPAYAPNQGSVSRYPANYGNYGQSPGGRPYAPPRQNPSPAVENYGNYGRSPSGRYYAPPRINYTPYYRPPNPYLPGGSLYSPFNMGRSGNGDHGR
jgi:hypothetical protein